MKSSCSEETIELLSWLRTTAWSESLPEPFFTLNKTEPTLVPVQPSPRSKPVFHGVSFPTEKGSSVWSKYSWGPPQSALCFHICFQAASVAVSAGSGDSACDPVHRYTCIFCHSNHNIEVFAGQMAWKGSPQRLLRLWLQGFDMISRRLVWLDTGQQKLKC